MPIVVLHRERSEKLAMRFVERLGEIEPRMDSWPDLLPEEREGIVQAFDALIQDGLIGER